MSILRLPVGNFLRNVITPLIMLAQASKWYSVLGTIWMPNQQNLQCF